LHKIKAKITIKAEHGQEKGEGNVIHIYARGILKLPCSGIDFILNFNQRTIIF